MLPVNPGKPLSPFELLGRVLVERTVDVLTYPLAVVLLPRHLLCLPRSGREALHLSYLSWNVSLAILRRLGMTLGFSLQVRMFLAAQNASRRWEYVLVGSKTMSTSPVEST